MLENMKRDNILEKISENEKKKRRVERLKERSLMEKNENRSLKSFLRSKNIKKIHMQNEYTKEQNAKNIEERFKRFQQFNQQRLKLKDIKRGISNELANKKTEVLKKLDYLFKREKLGEDVFEELEEMFRDNDELMKLIESIKINNYKS